MDYSKILPIGNKDMDYSKILPIRNKDMDYSKILPIGNRDRNYNKILQILLELGTTARYYRWRIKTRTKSSYYR